MGSNARDVGIYVLSRVGLFCNLMDCSLTDISVHGIFQTGIPGVGCHAHLQRIFLTQESNLCLLCLLHWQADSLPLCYLGSNAQDTYFKKYKNVKTICSVN